MTDEKSEIGGRDRAEVLVASFGKWLGVFGAELDRDDDRSFGEVGFHYNKKRDVLIARVYIDEAYMASDPAPVKENFRKVAAALNDPAIGGMFERGGGRFLLDEQQRKLFLIKELPVIGTTPRSLRTQMERLMNIGAAWSLGWLGRVARIAHGWEAPPTAPVLLDGPTATQGGEGGAR